MLNILEYLNADFKVVDNLKEIEAKWIEAFAIELPKERKYVDSFTYLWEALDRNKINYLEGKDAEDAFNNLKKKEYYIFFDEYRYEEEDLIGYKDKAFEVFPWNKLKSSDLNCSDIYIVDKEFTWTYVYTHEGYWCGPYFLKI